MFMVLYQICYFFQYYAESHAIIYVVDAFDRDRIQESKTVFGELTHPLVKYHTSYIFLHSSYR